MICTFFVVFFPLYLAVEILFGANCSFDPTAVSFKTNKKQQKKKKTLNPLHSK